MKVVLIGLAYFIGSIPSGYLLFRLGEKKDIRNFGSHATGATNILRLKGWRYALPVLVIDVLKAAIPVWLALKFFPDRRVAWAVSFLVVLGHCFPVFIRFRGGKGVSTALGAYAVLWPPGFMISLAIFVGIIVSTRFVSLGSLAASLTFPLLAFLWKNEPGLGLLGLAIFFLISLRHAGNIERLIHGRERKFGQKEKV
jgi:glycerol-3-phosphate acyltransferase PlsY